MPGSRGEEVARRTHHKPILACSLPLRSATVQVVPFPLLPVGYKQEQCLLPCPLPRPNPLTMAPSRLLAALLLSFTSRVAAHGSLVVPAPRNAVERGLAPWSGPMPSNWSHHVDDPICPTSSRDASGLTLANGQSCFWLSHGCTIFCDKCDGVTGRLPHKGTCGNEKTAKATVCDPLHRTINRKAECGTLADFYYYNPWRAPGSAPTFDACGMAGGASVAVAHATVGVRFQNTSFAKQGDLGSAVLPARPTGTVWKAGGTVRCRGPCAPTTVAGTSTASRRRTGRSRKSSFRRRP